MSKAILQVIHEPQVQEDELNGETMARRVGELASWRDGDLASWRVGELVSW